MSKRTELHEKLKIILENNNAYFQPPKNVSMRYPAIRYSLNEIDSQFADNTSYIKTKGYEAILITKDPEDKRIDRMMELSYARFDRMYVSDNLYHFVFTIYY